MEYGNQSILVLNKPSNEGHFNIFIRFGNIRVYEPYTVRIHTEISTILNNFLYSSAVLSQLNSLLNFNAFFPILFLCSLSLINFLHIFLIHDSYLRETPFVREV